MCIVISFMYVWSIEYGHEEQSRGESDMHILYYIILHYVSYIYAGEREMNMYM